MKNFVYFLLEKNIKNYKFVCDIKSKQIRPQIIQVDVSLGLVSIDKRVGSKNIIEENARRIGVRPSLIIEDEVLNALKENSYTPIHRLTFKPIAKD